MNHKKLFAFTLAEVLLTMTIIGVVAAMTIPTLHYQKTKQEYSAKLKNFYSRMDNAIMDMQVDKGSFRDMKQPENGYDWYMANIDPYLGHKYVKAGNKAVYYSDGSKLDNFHKGGCTDIIYDVNADKGPNKEGYDRFRFLICFTDNSRVTYFNNKDIFFGTYGSNINSSSTTRAAMVEKCKTNPPFCTRLLQNDQWEFKHDYPMKF